MIIDISEHNNLVKENFKLKSIEGVYIRLGFARTLDRKLKKHIDICEDLGIPYGFYYYSYSCSYEDAKNAAIWAQEMARKQGGKCNVLPLALDIESDPYKNARGVSFLTECKVMKAWKEVVKDLVIYVNKHYYLSMKAIDNNLFNDTKLWLAEWNNNENPSVNCWLWQYTSDYHINGLRTDANKPYFNIQYYKDIINGTTNKQQEEGFKLNDIVAFNKLKDDRLPWYAVDNKYKILQFYDNGSVGIGLCGKVLYNTDLYRLYKVQGGDNN